MKTVIPLMVFSTSFFFVGLVSAQIDENFDNYTLGNIAGQGPWNDFGGSLISEVSDEQANSGSQSLKLTLNPDNGLPVNPGYGSDTFMDMAAPVSSGRYQLSYDIYIPSEFDGTAHAFFSEGNLGMGGFGFGMQLIADTRQGLMVFTDKEADSPTEPVITDNSVPLVMDAWSSVISIIDFDANELAVNYDGQPLFRGQWDPDPDNALDLPHFEGVNLWVQDGVGSGSVYIDNLLFRVPEPNSLALSLFGCLSLLAIRRRLK